jgi:demethylmenaquinone methyltransferase / 2-methoxy-6-polyprenyl-1,4-benzoquinol methylase
MEKQDVPEVPRPLHGMFNAVPPHYDFINTIITLGLDKGWRRRAALACLKDKPKQILDLGCGTGDLSINIARLAEKDVAITGLDYSPPMLEKAQLKARLAGVSTQVDFVQGDATRIPFPEGHFDCVGISFAFRNLTYKNPLGPPHFAEVIRVLKPGGRYVIVESSQPENRIIRAYFHCYLRVYVATVGQLLSGNKGAYNYLAESARRYYAPREVRTMLLKAGFRDVSYQPLFFGAAGLHVALK